jgi:RP/EB family microtubule-associated protein
MAKVSWKAKADYEFLNNYKILQTAFDKFGIKRYIDVNPVLK